MLYKIISKSIWNKIAVILFVFLTTFLHIDSFQTYINNMTSGDFANVKTELSIYTIAPRRDDESGDESGKDR